MQKIVVVLGLICIGQLSPAGQAGAARKTENVVLVTLDGARWQEVFSGIDANLLRASGPAAAAVTELPAYKEFVGATAEERRRRLMPFLWTTLTVQHGFIAGDRTARSNVSVTNRLWFSYPGYAEILTGQAHDDVIKSNDPIRNPFPSVLQWIAQKRGWPAASAATFASWGVFNEIAESTAGATFVNAGLRVNPSKTAEVDRLNAIQQQARTPWANTRHDAFTFAHALEYLKRVHPRLLYIAFDETDDWAHDKHYELVLQMLRQTDAYLQQLWTTLQADPQYRDKTTLIVATDHGRGRTGDDWHKHGKDVPGADEIWLAIFSPDTSRRGVWQGAALFQNQIAATIAERFGLNYREAVSGAGAPIDLGK